MVDEAKQPAEEPESVGVGGNLIGDTKESRIERAAIKQRWPIPEKYREPIMNRAMKKLLDEETSDRDFNQTLNAILKAEAQNQADEHKQQPDEVNVNIELTNGQRSNIIAGLLNRARTRRDGPVAAGSEAGRRNGDTE